MRLFIAINFSEGALATLTGAREALRRAAAGRGSYTPEANLHLTLAVLGEVEPPRAALAAQAMDAAAGAPFQLVFDRAGRFRRPEGDIWWAGGPENPALNALQRRLERALTGRGFALERRRFAPHVTLARRVPELAGRPALFGTPAVERVAALDLMLSELGGGPPRYTIIARTALN